MSKFSVARICNCGTAAAHLAYLQVLTLRVKKVYGSEDKGQIRAQYSD